MYRQFSGISEVQALCEAFGVSRSGYYAWQAREPSGREQANERLVAEMRVKDGDMPAVPGGH